MLRSQPALLALSWISSVFVVLYSSLLSSSVITVEYRAQCIIIVQILGGRNMGMLLLRT